MKCTKHEDEDDDEGDCMNRDNLKSILAKLEEVTTELEREVFQNFMRHKLRYGKQFTSSMVNDLHGVQVRMKNFLDVAEMEVLKEPKKFKQLTFSSNDRGNKISDIVSMDGINYYVFIIRQMVYDKKFLIIQKSWTNEKVSTFNPAGFSIKAMFRLGSFQNVEEAIAACEKYVLEELK